MQCYSEKEKYGVFFFVTSFYPVSLARYRQRKAISVKTRLDYNAHKATGASVYVLLLLIYLGPVNGPKVFEMREKKCLRH